MVLGKRRRFRSRRKYRGRRRGYGRGKRTYRLIKRAIARSQELKIAYTTSFGQLYDASIGYYIFIQPTIPQGTGVGNRIGCQVNCRRMSFRWRNIFQANDTTSPQMGNCRYIIGRFKQQPAGGITAIVPNDFLEQANIFSQIDPQLFKAYYDKTLPYGTQGTKSDPCYSYWGYKCMHMKKKSFKWRRTWTYPTNAANTQIDYDSCLFFAVFTDMSVANKVEMALSYSVKTTFTD